MSKNKNPITIFNKNEIAKNSNFHEIEIIDGYYDGKEAYPIAAERAVKLSESTRSKNNTVVYTVLVFIFSSLLILSPAIFAYVNSIYDSAISSVNVMPDITSMSLEDAEKLLEGYTIIVEKVQSNTNFSEEGLVIKSNVNPGTPISEDQVIKLYVCKTGERSKVLDPITSVNFPEFPIRNNDIVFTSGKIQNGIITLKGYNDGNPFKDLSISIGQFNSHNKNLNERRFYFKDLNILNNEMFEISFSLTNENAKSFEINLAKPIGKPEK